MEGGEVVEDEHVAHLPPELDALLLDDLAAPRHERRWDLGAVRHRRRAQCLPVHPHHRVEPHPPTLPPREDSASFLGPRIVLAPPFASHSTSIPSARALNTHTWPIRARITVRYKLTVCLRGGQSQQRKKKVLALMQYLLCTYSKTNTLNA